MRIGECEVWVTCEGESLPEYDTRPEGDNGEILACFIPSDAGKKFALKCQNHSADDCLRFTLELDGREAENILLRPHEKGSIKGVYISTTMLQPFQFSPLETTDVDDTLHVPTSADLGTIRVRVERIELLAQLDSESEDDSLTFQPIGPVHERSKKLGAHCVKLGDATQVKTTTIIWDYKLVEPEKGPLVEFLFHYRPLALLQAQDIAPLPHLTPEPLHRLPTGQDSQDNDVRPAKRRRVGTPGSDGGIDHKPTISNLSDDDGDEDELGMLKGQLSQIMDRITQMEQKKKKKERRQDGGPLKVKKEQPVASSSRLEASSGDVIDLTLSD